MAVVVDGALVHPLTVAVTVYTPLAAVVTFGIEGSRSDEVKPFGPVQL